MRHAAAAGRAARQCCGWGGSAAQQRLPTSCGFAQLAASRDRWPAALSLTPAADLPEASAVLVRLLLQAAAAAAAAAPAAPRAHLPVAAAAAARCRCSCCLVALSCRAASVAAAFHTDLLFFVVAVAAEMDPETIKAWIPKPSKRLPGWRLALMPWRKRTSGWRKKENARKDEELRWVRCGTCAGKESERPCDLHPRDPVHCPNVQKTRWLGSRSRGQA